MMTWITHLMMRTKLIGRSKQVDKEVELKYESAVSPTHSLSLLIFLHRPIFSHMFLAYINYL